MASSPSGTTLRGMSNPAFLNALCMRITSSSRSSANRMIGSLFICFQHFNEYTGVNLSFYGVETYRHPDAASDCDVFYAFLNQVGGRWAAVPGVRGIRQQLKGEQGSLSVAIAAEAGSPGS